MSLTSSASDVSDGRPHANGPASLSERVKGLRLGGQLESAKRGGGSSWLPWTLCLIMAVTWASFAIRAYTAGGFKNLFGQTSSETTESTGGAAKIDPTQKSSGGPAIGLGEVVLPVKGNIVAAHLIQVSPIEVSGRVVNLDIVEGRRYKKGQMLAELDRTSFQADHDEAKAFLESAQARLKELEDNWPREVEQSQAQLEEAIALREQYALEFTRVEKSFKMGGVNEKEYETPKYALETQKAKVKQLQASLAMTEGPRKLKITAAASDVRQAQARYDRAIWRLKNCTIVAPVEGVVVTKRAEIGNLVNALAMNASLNGGVCDMADLTDLEVDLEVQERDISKIWEDQYCTVVVDAYPNRIYHAHVDRIMPVANSSKAVIPIRVKVTVPRQEEGRFLKPQMAAVATFYNRDADNEINEVRD